MARVRDLWFSEVTDPDDPEGKRKIKVKTKRHPDNGGSKDAKRWLAVWLDPSGRERTKAFAVKAHAKRYADDQESDARRGAYIDPRSARMTVREWCATWLAGYRTRRASTVRQAEVHIAQITAEFGDLPLSAVRPSHVRSWCARLKDEGAADSYVYALHARLSQIMGDAVHDGLLVRSPCSRRTSPGAGKQRPYVATTAQVWALYDAMGERYRVAILLAAFAGLRAAEACGLRVADVDFLRGVISPAVQYPADELKTEAARTPIPIPRLLAEHLSAQVAAYPAATILTSARGGQLAPRTLNDAFAAARDKVAGLPDGFRYHDLRHYYASLLIASGADVKTVQARLRHASAKTTLDTYAHLWPDRDESTRAAVEAVLVERAEQRRNQAGAR
ncbi:site-specific integrase [Actinomadura sp. NBRC 104425]|uniref:site-specific integrase n=1 Tax=Actinomadura sp. NBRC 104425 TaxID=3032204 RepID=UPI0024A31CC5|nr:site-specific integrase [Actinomadura sp. NBRC 104425]GLZ13675.1 site-specific integrase [Actinomadura sp. NBRC 104425]